MRVLLDTNILASAFATRGICEDILREALTFHRWICCEVILVELERVLKNKFTVPEPICREILEFLRSNATMAVAADPIPLPLTNEADIRIVSDALAAGVHILVTGDKEIVALGRVEGMRILSPRRFWELLQGR